MRPAAISACFAATCSHAQVPCIPSPGPSIPFAGRQAVTAAATTPGAAAACCRTAPQPASLPSLWWLPTSRLCSLVTGVHYLRHLRQRMHADGPFVNLCAAPTSPPPNLPPPCPASSSALAALARGRHSGGIRPRCCQAGPAGGAHGGGEHPSEPGSGPGGLRRRHSWQRAASAAPTRRAPGGGPRQPAGGCAASTGTLVLQKSYKLAAMLSGG